MSDDKTYNDAFTANIMKMFPVKEPCPLCKIGKVHGKNVDGEIEYFLHEGQPIKVCNDCNEKANPAESSKQHKAVSDRVNIEERLRKQYCIPSDRGVKEWVIEQHGKKVRINGEYVVVDNLYY